MYELFLYEQLSQKFYYLLNVKIKIFRSYETIDFYDTITKTRHDISKCEIYLSELIIFF